MTLYLDQVQLDFPKGSIYYLAHKYIDKMGIIWLIDIELIQKSLESIKYLVLHLWVSTITWVWIF